jgi:hypothetical protein
MKKFAWLALAGLTAFQTQAFAGPTFNFKYQSADGQIQLDCVHAAQANDSWDFQVVCGKGTPLQRSYFVHLMIKKYTRTVEPKMALETVYFVTDRKTPNDPKFTSHSSWVMFKGEQEVYSVQLSQSVENDYAYLMVTLSP